MNVLKKHQESEKGTGAGPMGDRGGPRKIGDRGARGKLETGGPAENWRQGEHHSTDPRTAENAGNEPWESDKQKIIHVLADAIQSCSSVKIQ